MNGNDAWFCNNCNFEVDTDSYDGLGYIIRSRHKNWQGLTQAIDPSNLEHKNSLTLASGFYIQLLDGPGHDVKVMSKLRVIFEGGSKKFLPFTPYIIKPSTNAGWHEVSVTTTFDTSS